MTRKRTTKAGQAPPPEEKGLWDQVKTTIEPLDANQRALYSHALAEYLDGPMRETNSSKARSAGPTTPHAPALEHPVPMPGKGMPARKQTSSSSGQHKGPATPPLIDLDRKARTRIARGRTPIDARVDLHGLRQHEAQDVLRSFIWRAHQSGHRTVLVITGKGSRQKDPHPHAPPWAMGSGILRKAVPGWLSSPDLRAAVLSFEPASPSHGGEGALYVRLRARRR
jgi:DNA-nicking Smr family endonuclease